MNFSRKNIALYVGLVFLSGAVLGAFGDRVYSSYGTGRLSPSGKESKNKQVSPEEYRRGYIGFMQKRLALTDPQVVKLGLIFDETRARMNEIHERAIPEQQDIQKAQTEKIREFLTPAQQAEYEVMLKERRERMKKGGQRGGPGGF